MCQPDPASAINQLQLHSTSNILHLHQPGVPAQAHLRHIVGQAGGGGKIRVVDVHRHIVAAGGVGEHEGVDVDAGALGLGQRGCTEGWDGTQ